MKKSTESGGKFTENAKSFGRIITDDIRHGDLPGSWLQDFKDIYHFYLDKKTKKKLADMGKIKQALYIFLWLCKSLFLKLAPARRIMLLSGLVLLTNFINVQTGIVRINNLNIMGLLLIVSVLALELKDKLLARDELAIGRKVQKALLPTEHPHLSGWEIWLYTRPANEVGGDLVDFIEINSEQMGLTLGDVAGKGLGAALLMAKLQATVRALAPEEPRLATLGKRVNRILYRDGLRDRFATLIYLQLKKDSGEIQILNAGHMPPFIIHDKKLEELRQGGIALGLAENSEYKEEKVTMNKGDYLLAYSDGLTEAKNDKDEFYGDERLKTLLIQQKWTSVENLGRMLVKSVNDFAGKARPNDDLSLVIIRRI
ncbi:serine/threonine-protein phosphatase [bacterium]|nr:serine/threonine-protein phosphatase [bacterium]